MAGSAHAGFGAVDALHLDAGMNRLVSFLICVVTMSGCYFGRSPTGKTVAYATNGALVGLGALAASGKRDSDETQVGRIIGTALITAAVVGIIVNLAIPTDHPQPPPVTAQVADGDAASITY